MSRKHKPRLGQNFLTDLAARQRTVAALGDISTATVVEIGPGHGALTDLLAPRAGRLLAIELDRELAPALAARFAARPSVTILCADILAVELAAHLTDEAAAGTPVHIIGNLPYYVTSDILLHLFRTVREQPGLISTAVLMVQREVADRVASPPGRRDFGLLSATAQLHATPEILFTLGPESFSPPPDVDSSVLRLLIHPRFAELDVEATAFDRFLHQAFAQKRKTLSRNLRNAGLSPGQLAAVWPPNLDHNIRAEATTLEQLAHLHRALIETAPDVPAAPPPAAPHRPRR